MAKTALLLQVTVTFSPAPREVFERDLQVPSGTTAQQALEMSGVEGVFAQVNWGNMVTGLWGKNVDRGAVLQNGDRIELYRPLKVDPKQARRERFQKQGAKSAGLFNTLRKGAKQGY